MTTDQLLESSHPQPFELLALPNELIDIIVDEAIKQDMEDQRHFYKSRRRARRPRFNTLMLAQSNKLLHQRIKPIFFSKVVIVLAPNRDEDHASQWLRTDWESVGSDTRYRPPHAFVQHLAIAAAISHDMRHACAGLPPRNLGDGFPRGFVASLPNLRSVTFTHGLGDWHATCMVFSALEKTLPPYPHEAHIGLVAPVGDCCAESCHGPGSTQPIG